MRCYFFGNFYMSSIQQGIQASHVVSEMFVKYRYSIDHTLTKTEELEKILNTWAIDHKTVVLLNGGDADALIDMKAFLNDSANPYPHAFFEESPGALNGCLTSVGVVLPERMYDAVSTKIGRAYLRIRDAGPQVVVDMPPLDNELMRLGVMVDFRERKYTDWELRFLARRVACDLAR